MSMINMLAAGVAGGASGPTVITANVVASTSTPSGSTITKNVDGTGASLMIVHYMAFATVAFTGVSATYNGNAMTEEWRNDPAAGTIYEGCFSIKSPTSGTQTVIITFTGSTFVQAGVIGCIPMSGTNATTPTGTAVTASDLTGTSNTATVTVSSASGETVLGFVAVAGGGTPTNGAGQTTVWSVDDIATDNAYYRVTQEAGAASVVTDFTFTNQLWLEGGQSIKP